MRNEDPSTLDARLDEALDESFPASDPPAVHLPDEGPELSDMKSGPRPTVPSLETEGAKSAPEQPGATFASTALSKGSPSFAHPSATMDQPADPRVFLAAERSLLAWNRTCLAMMGLGFVIERFGLFLRLLDPAHVQGTPRGSSYVVGLALMAFASLLAVYSTFAFRDEIAGLAEHERRPTRYASLGIIANLGVAAAGVALTAYLVFAAR